MSSLTTVTPAPSGALWQLIRRLHFYIGLFVAPFIFIAALTGTLYVLTPQLENLLYRDALHAPVGAFQPLEAQIAAARAYAGESVPLYAVRPAPAPGDTTRVQFVAQQPAPSESRAVFIDPATLRVTGDMTVYGTTGVLPLRTWLDQLHRGLLLGDAGRIYSELAASWLWVAAVGGIALWWRSRPGQRQRRQPRRGARHWHITLGLLLALGLVFFSVTGLTWSQWAGNNIDRLRSELGWMTPQLNTRLAGGQGAMSDAHSEHHGAGMMAGMVMPGGPVNPPDSDWGRALHAARQGGIQAAQVELRQPRSTGSAWTVTEVDRRWPTRVDAVALAPGDFQIIDRTRFADFPLVAKLTRWGVDAHMGVLFGVANQLLLALFGGGLCVIIVLGYRLWWRRRPAAGTRGTLQTLTQAWLALSWPGRGISLLLAVALGVALPVMGWSLVLLLVVDILRRYCHHTAAARIKTAV
ncbi:PepSY domain-containing protein [Shimwellia pseudoproteus]|nr:PepSY domain-containing protein [Shimwellia pseudoproteus]